MISNFRKIAHPQWLVHKKSKCYGRGFLSKIPYLEGAKKIRGIQCSFRVSALKQNENPWHRNKQQNIFPMPERYVFFASTVLLLVADTFPHHSTLMHSWKHFHLFLTCVWYRSTRPRSRVCGWIWRKPAAHLHKALLNSELRFKCS